jgi:hypothetical protein
MDILEARSGSRAILGKSGLDLETRGDGHPLTETTAIPRLREASTDRASVRETGRSADGSALGARADVAIQLAQHIAEIATAHGERRKETSRHRAELKTLLIALAAFCGSDYRQ